jgi:hypothetical protein
MRMVSSSAHVRVGHPQPVRWLSNESMLSQPAARPTPKKSLTSARWVTLVQEFYAI